MHEFFKHPLEVGVGICATASNLFNEGVDDGTAPAGVFAANKHPVLVSELGGTYRVFHGVVVKFELPIFKTRGELRPLVLSIMERLTQGALGGDAAAQDEVLGDSNEMLVNAKRPSSPCSFSEFWRCVALP